MYYTTDKRQRKSFSNVSKACGGLCAETHKPPVRKSRQRPIFCPQGRCRLLITGIRAITMAKSVKIHGIGANRTRISRLPQLRGISNSQFVRIGEQMKMCPKTTETHRPATIKPKIMTVSRNLGVTKMRWSRKRRESFAEASAITCTMTKA